MQGSKESIHRHKTEFSHLFRASWQAARRVVLLLRVLSLLKNTFTLSTQQIVEFHDEVVLGVVFAKMQSLAKRCSLRSWHSKRWSVK